MVKTRVQINSVVENQIPAFVREDFPLVTEFLKEYYRSQEIDGASYDIIQNIDQYIKLDQLSNLIDSTTVQKSGDDSYLVNLFDTTIFVESTEGFPESYGLIKINDEIITYRSKTDTSFVDCIRGFSGVENLKDTNNPEKLVFSTSETSEHTSGSTITNLSILFLKEFLQKLKKQISPGFENRDLDSNIDEKLFLSHSKDFYSSKGTDDSFKILFKSLYGTNVEVIKPRDFLIQPSDAGYRVTRDVVVEAISGNPLELVNRTLFQDYDGFISRSYGSVTSVEKITRSGKEYYILSLDYDFDKDISVSGSIFGEFSIHPKTLLVSDASIGKTILDVDSTVGFPSAGSLEIRLNNGNVLNITYTSKSLNQFFGCSGITEEVLSGQEVFYSANAYAFLDRNTNERIEVRIGGVLSDFNIPENTFQYEKGDSAKIVSLGSNDANNLKLNNWIFNIPVEYNVESFGWLNSVLPGQPQPLIYRNEIFTYDSNNIYKGDRVELDIIIRNLNTPAEPLSRIKKQFVVESRSIPNKSFIINNDREILKVYTAKKLLTKSISDYSANIQNTYEDNSDVYVASASLPNYSNQDITTKNRSIQFSGVFGNPFVGITTDTIIFRGSGGSLRTHGFLTGDAVVYIPGEGSNSLSIPKSVYFVKKIDINTIKLSSSRENISNNIFLNFYGNITDNKFIPLQFVDSDLNEKVIDSQRLIRKLSDPQSDGVLYDTEPGFIGILANGVEILNYKSQDTIYYGGIENISVSSKGSNYDVINPPVLEITDSTGIGAEGICGVTGSLSKINIIDSGFDYTEEPIISITGGNGSGAKAKANLVSIDHISYFNSEENSGLINLIDNSITFNTDHKFRNNEKVFYLSGGQKSIGGLVDNSIYYVSVQNSRTVKIHKTLNDSISGINTISLTSYGSGIQSFKSYNSKKIIGSISIINPGSGYKNKKVAARPNQINLANHTINIPSHGFNSGEVIYYNSSSTEIGGLSEGEYVVTKVNDNSFKVSLIGSPNKYFYYETNQYVEFTSIGSGLHYFNYPDISVKITGSIGISTFSGQDYFAKIQPIFRGSIESVFILNGGSNYGSEEILNLNRKPQYTFKNGTNAKLQPVISNGKITQILILNSGSDYNSPPDIVVYGSGSGAVLTPIIENGRVSSVKIINGGFNYNKNTTSIVVNSAGQNCKLDFKLKSWNINLVERLKSTNQISSNDGIVSNGIAEQYGLEYSHAYAPKKLREIVFSANEQDGNITYRADLENDTSSEVYHSPIIGWAYDGNPIYGPYGYDNPDGGIIKQLISSYSDPIIKSGRPSTSLYPLGFFVEDYEFNESGDLDVYNGRFCKTPEFPNGTYAYFTSLQNVLINGEKTPKFPYLIGNKFKSKPIEFNYEKTSNQDEINIQNTNWLRNTTPYNLNSENSRYLYIINPNEIKQQISDVTYASSGKLDNIKILQPGSNYKIGDTLLFNNEGTDGYDAHAIVSSIKGKDVEKIESNITQISNIEIIPSNNSNEYIVYSNSTHEINNGEIVSVSGLGTYFSALEKSYVAKINQSKLTLSVGVGNSSITGIITYFDVYGNLNYQNIRENDIYSINNEIVKILNIDINSSRIRVLRQSGISSHLAGDILTEIPRKLRFLSNNQLNYNYQINKEIYINPSESIGIGTVGIGSTLLISNPGIGATQIFVPLQNIYIPDHNLNTGDLLKYYRNGNSRISVFDGYKSFDLTQSLDLYAAKITDDLIGISTNKIGIGSTGSFIGIGTNTNLLYFTSIGTGENHSFRTLKSSVVSANLDKKVVTVTTTEPHNLNFNDDVTIKCTPGVIVTIKIKYNSENRRLVVNPNEFLSSDINLETSSITLINHGYKSGDNVIYSSDSPSTGLENNKIYYIVSVDNNTIKLSESFYNTSLSIPVTVPILSKSNGTISKINPEISVFKNNKVIFDLSDESLSYLNGSTRLPGFDFKLFKDPNFTDEFISSKISETFDIIKSGIVGTPNAKVELSVSENIPNNLYYNLIPLKNPNNSVENVQIISDSEYIINANKLKVSDSLYNGKNKITDVTDNTFSYTISVTPESNAYVSGVEYSTTSKSALGGIDNIILKSRGNSYKKLPSIDGIISDNGSGAILLPESGNIGNVKTIRIIDIGFDYSSDYSIRPTAKLPDILKIEPLSTFDRIDITYKGRGYDVAPELIVLDGVTGKLVDDVILKYEVDQNQVTIIKNSTGFYNSLPTIIPINNPNGVGISTISFNDLTKDVIVTLNKEYSDIEDFPFLIGDEIFIENISIIEGTGIGYNSENYNYSYFTITNIDRNIGGGGSQITYNLSSVLNGISTPGSFDFAESYGRVIPVKDFPIFAPILKKNEFLIKEHVSAEGTIGIVEKWDSQNEYLKVETTDLFKVNTIIKGKTSGSQGIISSVNEFKTTYTIDSSSIVKKGWNKETGFLNNNTQRIHNNDYYQYFSYSIKSPISYETWNEPVSTLNHTSGFKKFSDLIVESYDSTYSGINTSQNQGDFFAIADLTSIIDIDCYNDFDLVSENYIKINENNISNEIIFNSREIQDYSESIGNKVLTIDNISTEFNHLPRLTPYTIVDTFRLDLGYSRKYITYIKDKRYTDERQIMLITILNDDNYIYLNQYARLETYRDLGSFDVLITGNEGNLVFYPNNFEFNDYDISFINYSFNQVSAGIGSTSFGDVVTIFSDTYTVPSDSAQTIVTLPISSYRSAKLLVEFVGDNGKIEFDELTIIHDGINVDLLEYGQLTNTFTSFSSSGFGTYYPRISGSNILIDYIPSISGIGVSITTIMTAISSTGTSVGNNVIDNGSLDSFYTGLSSAITPSPIAVATYDNTIYDSAYYIVSVEDITNGNYQTQEIVVVNDSSNTYISEYGILEMNNTIGLFSVNSTGSNLTQLQFTPIPNIETKVRVFQNALKLVSAPTTSIEI
jgi:hypothetical protein